jgi:hypothetical protein
MIERGADDIDGIASTAAWYGHIGLVEAMIERGATNFNEIARSAAKNGHCTLVDMMIGRPGFNWVGVARSASSFDYLGIVVNVISKGFDVVSDHETLTLLAEIAAKYGLKDLVDRAISQGVDPNPLSIEAAYYGHHGLVDSLIECGASDLNGIAASAAEGGHQAIVDEMIAKGASRPEED